MRLGNLLLSLTLLSAPSGLSARGLDSVAAALDSLSPFSASVSYSITLPQAEDDILYSVSLLCPAEGQWLIDWAVNAAGQTGWTAQTGGDFYNYRNRRLQEIHSGWDKQTPPRAQFAELLPANIAAQLREIMATPDRYTYEITESADRITINANRLSAGRTDAEFLWTFDSAESTPLTFSADYNPGAISSQQISARYTYADQPATALIATIDEETLRARYPDAFTNHRQSNFAIEQMRGEPLPAFSLPLADGTGRLTRDAGQDFRQPTLIILLESQSSLAPDLVADIRSAIDRSPVDADVVWACAERNPNSAADLLGELRPGETALIGSKSLAADCGAAALPVILVCRPDGTVADLAIGLNKDTSTDVIQMITKL